VTLALVRVDDRLIHGQVVAVWLRALRAARILIVDDATAADEFLRTVLTLAAPAGVPVEVHGVDAAAGRVRELAAAPDRTMILVRTPASALRLREAGVSFDVLNVGGMGAAPGRHLLHRSISASPDELAAMRRLEELGTRVELRVLADDRPIPFAAVDGGTGAGPEGGARSREPAARLRR
jgi:D-glucosaminate PTS system EIIB component